MLARGNTDAARRLRRSKSTTSVPRRFPAQNLPPRSQDTTNKHALTAAALAFENAKLRPMEQRTAMAQQPASRTRYSRKSLDGFRGLRPKPSRTKISPSKASAKERQERRPRSACQLTPISQRTSFLPSEQASTLGTGNTPNTEDLRFADRFDGYGVPAHERYKKAQTYYGHEGTHGDIETPNAYSISRPPVFTHPRIASPAIREYQTDEAIIALARDRYLQDHQPQPLKQRHSFISHSLRSRLRKSERFSWQASSTASQDRPSIENRNADPMAGHAVYQGDPHLFSKPKKYSIALATLKKTWRRAIGRSSSGGSTGMPPQQVQSNRPHYRQPTLSEYDNNFFYPVPCGTDMEDWAFERPPTPPPHLEGVEPLENFRSVDEDVVLGAEFTPEERSRVTSWNDSTRQSTIVSKDMDPLPSIKESIESHFESNGALSGQTAPNSARHSSSRFSLKQGIDSRRLVSAIMKHTRKSMKGAHKTPMVPVLDRTMLRSTSELYDSTDEGHETGNESFEDHFHRPSAGSVDLLAPRTVTHTQSGDNLGLQAQPRTQVMSPSIYSERQTVFSNDSTSSVEQISSPIGTARVLASEAVTKWQVGGRAEQRHQSTSSEWRHWAADKFAGLESLDNLALSGFGSQVATQETESVHSTTDRVAEDASDVQGKLNGKRVPSNPSICNTSGDLPAVEQNEARTTFGRQQWRPFGRQLSFMNDRFPLLNSGRTASKSSFFSSKRIYSPDPDFHEQSDTEYSITHQDKSNNSTEPSNRKTPGINNPDDEDKSISKVSHSMQQTRYIKPLRLSPVPKSVVSTTQVGRREEAGPLSTRKQNHLDENFLLRIRRGPYNNSTTSLDNPTNESVDSICLPKRRSPATKSQSKENTPPSTGQRMAKEFLNRRANNETVKANTAGSSSPAFL